VVVASADLLATVLSRGAPCTTTRLERYSLKSALRTKRVLKCQRVLTATADVRKKAEELYAADRKAYLRGTKSWKVNPLWGLF
jgi:hypothetical protein